ncbi:hypothetical protein DSO57_1010920 [Entomophthora muscae]|uniref:Uncharacterized protein n=1 Tax=Entomophthora muscae TaxID=34485 RepID=A0ACC2U550_9FUNG|nr:hypothetical protein DSO57_1010920 [Entomophthora muscae]
MLLFFLSLTFGFSLLEIRIQEARIHTPVYEFIPPQSFFLNKPAGFASRGWVPPGEYPQEDEMSCWINAKSYGNYTVEKQKRFCVSHTDGTDFIETCYTHIMSTFWWGKPIRLSNKYLCIGNSCHFSLVSNTITLEGNNSVLDKLVKVPLPPNPWRIHARFSSQLNLEGEVYRTIKGFFWFKPIYWATLYHVHRTAISALNTTSNGNIQAVIYPVSKADNLEGLIGFYPGPLDPDLEFQRPSFFEFYPNQD